LSILSRKPTFESIQLRKQTFIISRKLTFRIDTVKKADQKTQAFRNSKHIIIHEC